MSTLTHRDPNRAALFAHDPSSSPSPTPGSSSTLAPNVPSSSYSRSLSASPAPIPSYGAQPGSSSSSLPPSYGRTSSPNPYSYYGGMNGHAGSPGGGQQGGQGSYASRTAEQLESQNDEAIEGLSAKVKMLKEISIGIGTEVRDSSKLLSSMNDSFAEAGGLLAGTFRRMNVMARSQGGRWWYWMIFLIIVFWVFVITWLWRR